MIIGTHIVFYSENAEADRAFFRDTLKFRSVDAGHGWLIFGLPPAEAGLHPAGEVPPGAAPSPHAEVYLMCDDLEAQIKELESKKVPCGPVEKAAWGMKTTLRLPRGKSLGLYQPRHATVIDAR